MHGKTQRAGGGRMIAMSVNQLVEAISAQIVSNARANRSTQDTGGQAVSGTWGDNKVSRAVIDSRIVQEGDLFFAIRGEKFDGHDFVQSAFEKGAAVCVVDRKFVESNPTVRELNVLLLVVDDTVDALGWLGAYYRSTVMSADTTVIAVTGSNGKTTTKRMIDHVLRDSFVGRASEKSFNNQYGVPLTLLSCEVDDQYLIVEIGTNAPGEIATLSKMTSPDIAVITSIGEAHLEGLGDVDAIVKEKLSLIDYVRPGSATFVNGDREEMAALVEDKKYNSEREKINVKTIGFSQKADYSVSVVELSLEKTVFSLEHYGQFELPLPGLHHATNAAAAFCVANHMGINPITIIRRLATFSAVDGRSRVIEVGGVKLVDDTYNANPASVSAAVTTLGQLKCSRRIFVLGDMFELGEHSLEMHKEVIQLMVDAEIEIVVTVGEISFSAVNPIKNKSHRTKILSFQKHQDASSALVKMLIEGDVVWLKGSRVMALERVVNEVSEQLTLYSTVIESGITSRKKIVAG